MNEDMIFPVNGCLPKVSNTWRTLFGPLSGINRVHPSDPVPAKDSEFILIESKVKIRVIHLIPEKIRSSFIINNENVSSKRSSLSEEYWFERNKPLRNLSCRCSFRRSKVSIGSNKVVLPPKQAKCDNFVLVSERIKNVENFVEHLIQETLQQTFQEFFLKCSKSGIENLAYENSETEFQAISKEMDVGHDNDQFNQTFLRSSTSSYRSCIHKKNIAKPLIMFIHGLGCTAEIWNILMYNLSFKGFEIIAPDLLGHGFSSAPKKANFYQFKNLLVQTIAVFDYFMEKEEKRKCVLIGHSYGCSLVTALYPHRAAKIAQLVLISGGGPTPLAPPAELNDISPFGCALNLCYPFLYCGVKRSFFYSSRGKNFRPCEKETTVPPHIMEYLIQGQYWPEGDAAFHRRIMVPTLLVHGLQDKNVTLVQECEMERTIPRAYLELLPNAGHMSIMETPDQLTHMITCFLEMWS